MFLISSDIEYLIITIFLVFLFLTGIKRRQYDNCNIIDFIRGGVNRWLSIDYNFSSAIKGIACVLILMGHYRTTFLPISEDETLITKIVGMSSANVALFLFMFFSGYGLSLKEYKGRNIIRDWFARVSKIYLPLLVTCVLMIAVFALLPDIFSPSEAKSFHVSSILHELHNIDSSNITKVLLAGIGWGGDWYVKCILMFYTIFYISVFVCNKISVNQTIILSILMLVYFVWAYNYYGAPAAHYYRYPWVFMLGHIVAMWNKNPKKLSIIIMSIFMLTEIPCGLYYHIFSIMALSILLFVAFINTRYEMKSTYLLFMGGISYYYFLCHERIVCTIIAYTGIKSLLLWALITIPIAFLISMLHKIIIASCSFHRTCERIS